MTKKKKEKEQDTLKEAEEEAPSEKQAPKERSKPRYEKKLIARHWAREEGLDETLFLAWNDEELTKAEFNELKGRVSTRL